jgi:hypothetical protein
MLRRLILIHVVFWTIVRLLCLGWLGIDRVFGGDTAEGRVPGAPRGFGRSGRHTWLVPPAVKTVLDELRLSHALAARLSLLAYPDLEALALALEEIPPDTLRERIGAAYGVLDALGGVPNRDLRLVLAQAFGPGWDVVAIWNDVRYEDICARITRARAQLAV